MATATKALIARPQPLGILPTWWFWNDRENWRLVRWPFAAFVFISALVMSAISLPYVVEIAGFLAMYCIGLGAIEKYIRQQAMKRRALAEAPDENDEQAVEP